MADPGDRVVDVAAGSSHSVALVSCSGRNVVVSWGRAEDGQLGHGNPDEQNRPRKVLALLDADITSVTCGAEYTVATSASQKQVYTWGWGDFGRLGHGDAVDVFVPRPVAALAGKTVTVVACGDTHTLVVLEGGKLLAFGRNQNGQLGSGEREDSLLPVEVAALSSSVVVGVACGAEHSLCVTADGRVLAWGWGRYGNLGHGTKEDQLLPTCMKGLDGVVACAVAAGWRHSMVVDDSGRLYTCGWSKYGQLGHGDTRDRAVPLEITQVRGGWRHTSAVTSDGLLYAWGWNRFGQLGLGHSLDVCVPQLVVELMQAQAAMSAVACGWRHTLAVTTSGAVYTWGRGTNGQLGLGTNVDACTPVLLEALSAGSIDPAAFEHEVERSDVFVAASDRYALVPDGDSQRSYHGIASVPVVPDCDMGEPKRPRHL